MKRSVFFIGGLTALLLGILGIFLPLLPTVPFMVLAAFCFARSSPRMEEWLLTHPYFGPHIAAWRERGAISHKGKRAAIVALGVSSALSVWLLPWPVLLVTPCVGIIVGGWIWRRPDA